MKTALTIAGSDSSGGAGIQADIKTISANGVYAMSVITAITAQNTMGVNHIQVLDDITVKKQIEAIFEDIKVDSIKIGMVANETIINTIYETLAQYNLPQIVLDPVMIATSGSSLLSESSVDVLVEKIFPISTLITPNIQEAEKLANMNIECEESMRVACKKIIKLGCKNVLLKGGHLKDIATDVLYSNGEYYTFKQKKINNPNTHGTGCTLSSAIAANLSKGDSLFKAVEKAKNYVTKAITYGFKIGNGSGPTNHFWKDEI